MKKIALISHVPTHPTIAGNRARIKVMIDEYRRMGIDVDFFYASNQSADYKGMREWIGDENLKILPNTHTKRWSLNWMLKIISKKLMCREYSKPPHRIDMKADFKQAKKFGDIVFQNRYDAVQVEYIFYSYLFKYIPYKTVRILDTHDVFSYRQELFKKNNERPSWYSTTSYEEAKGLKRSDIVIAIQESEAQYFKSITNREVITVGHIVDVINCKYTNLCKGKSLIFLGSKNEINRAGFSWFISEVWPLIRTKKTDAALELWGDICELFHDVPEGVLKQGRSLDIEKVYKNAAASICPLRFGTGLKIKAIEALGQGVPLVSTPSGMEGLEEAKAAMIVEKTAKGFAEACLQLLSNNETRKAMAIAAIRFANRWNTKQRINLSKVVDKIESGRN